MHVEQIKGTPLFLIDCVMIPTVNAQTGKKRQLTPHYTVLHLTTPHLTSSHQILIPSKGFTTSLLTYPGAWLLVNEQVDHSQRAHQVSNLPKKEGWLEVHSCSTNTMEDCPLTSGICTSCVCKRQTRTAKRDWTTVKVATLFRIVLSGRPLICLSLRFLFLPCRHIRT